MPCRYSQNRLSGVRVVPIEALLRERCPQVRWLDLAARRSGSGMCRTVVFVIASRHETFGLVMLEAILPPPHACCRRPARGY